MARYYKNKYKYTKKYTKEVQNKEPIVHNDETSRRWQKLLKYYTACISTENAGDVEFYSNREHKDFIQIQNAGNQEWLISGREKLEIEDGANIQDFISGPRWSKTTSSYFYGFPCYIKYIERSRRGWSGHILQPILIFSADFSRTSNGYSFVLQSDRPRINSAFLRDKTLLTSIEERKHLTEVIISLWDENQGRAQNIRKILESIAEMLPQGIPFPKDLLEGNLSVLSQHENTNNGIYPVAMVFKSLESPYTRGLEQEITELHNNSVPNNIWREILERTGTVIEDNEQLEELLEITPLNDEQRNAIQSAFLNTITVVTGPPGTGKSQVVLNIIINALLHDETVLFSSKNHKAVDVVIERLLRLQSEPVILKYGQREKEVEFAESLLAAIERSSGYNNKVLEHDINEYQKELENISLEEKRAKETLLRILERRNSISKLDLTLEQIGKEVPPVITKRLTKNRIIQYSKQFATILNKTEKLFKQLELNPNLFSRFLSVFGLPLDKRILSATSKLIVIFPLQGMKFASDTVDRCKEVITVSKLLKQWCDTQGKLLAILEQNESEASIEVLRERLTKSKEKRINVSIKYADALMKKRLKALGGSERRDITDYVSVVRRLEGDMTGGNLAEDLRKESKRMFKSVVKAFPAMAVTNLSVRHALPLTSEVIDIVVIDEASQCDIASALPLLYRAKRTVIIGDPNQLSHISMLNKTDDQQLQREIGLTLPDDQRFLYSLTSLFDMGRTVIGTGAKFVHLLEHYRSRAEIIGFSNKRFYGDKLSVWTDYRKLKGTGQPTAVVWHNICGNVVRPSQGSAYNIEEAKEVVNLIQQIVKHIIAQGDGYTASLGVVTPFREQANKIRDLLEQKIDSNQLRKLDFIVDTAHKFQGDERDIMIFSPVISHNTPQKSLGFLGNTINLFNVAITRARAELHIVGDRVACAQCNIPHLSEFVKYVEQLEPENLNQRGGIFESPWEEVLYNALKEEGIRAIPQYPLNQYRLDLAIVDSTIPVDVEIDGELWHRDIDGGRLLSDIRRDQHLIVHGWQVKRFWVYQLQHNLSQCIQEIKELIEQKI